MSSVDPDTPSLPVAFFSPGPILSFPGGVWAVDENVMAALEAEFCRTPELPDGQAWPESTTWASPNGVLSHLRFAALHAAAGPLQPIAGAIGRWSSIYNGERREPWAVGSWTYNGWAARPDFPYSSRCDELLASPTYTRPSLAALVDWFDTLALVPPLAPRATALASITRRMLEQERIDLGGLELNRLAAELAVEDERAALPDLVDDGAGESKALAEWISALDSLLRPAAEAHPVLAERLFRAAGGSTAVAVAADWIRRDTDNSRGSIQNTALHRIVDWLEMADHDEVVSAVRELPSQPRATDTFAMLQLFRLAPRLGLYEQARRVINNWMTPIYRFTDPSEPCAVKALLALDEAATSLAKVGRRPYDLSVGVRPIVVAEPSDSDGLKNLYRRIAASTDALIGQDEALDLERQLAIAARRGESIDLLLVTSPGCGARRFVRRVAAAWADAMGVSSRPSAYNAYLLDNAPSLTPPVDGSLPIVMLENMEAALQKGDTRFLKGIRHELSHVERLPLIMTCSKERAAELLAAAPDLFRRVVVQELNDLTVEDLTKIALMQLGATGVAIEDEAQMEAALGEAIDNTVPRGDFQNARRAEAVVERAIDRWEAGGAEGPLRVDHVAHVSLNLVEDHVDALASLDKLVGIEQVKDEVRRMAAEAWASAERKKQGLPSQGRSLHLVFAGNPGTAKTTVARILGRIYSDMGVLTTGQVVEVSRGDLIGEYTGQTAPKVAAAVERALGGVLFIDEAYLLATSDTDGFGQEAIGMLVKLMEDYRGQFMVIAAGYTEPMRRLLDRNPGFAGRFSRTINFSDYSVPELLEIAQLVAAESHYSFSDQARLSLQRLAETEQRRPGFANGRSMRSIVEQAIANQALRIKVSGEGAAVSSLLEATDIPTKLASSFAVGGDPFAELDELIGLDDIKAEVKRIVAEAKVREERRRLALPELPRTLHMIFTGDPGTAKTTVARIIGRILAQQGVVATGQVVEVSRGDMIAGYVGQTALRVQEVVKSALGGVLFIDEAYLLAPHVMNDYGDEAIGTLLKLMEDYRDQFVVIAAGYEGRMDAMVASNPGFVSRFGARLHFPNYDLKELESIAVHVARSAGYEFAADAKFALRTELKFAMERSDFANGRSARSIVERASVNLAERALSSGDFSAESLTLIRAQDVTDKSRRNSAPGGGSAAYL